MKKKFRGIRLQALKNCDIHRVVSRYKVEISKLFSQGSPQNLNVWTVPEKMREIFLSGTAKGAVWVLRDTNLCQKRVCGKYSMQKSVLKINKCRAISTLESQGIYAAFQ